MPKFSTHEKARIEKLLLAEGERLFIAHGLKKVTIDDLARSVNIAKASFYKFYDSKEHLFLAIVQKQRQDVLQQLNNVLDESAALPDRTRVRQVLDTMIELMKKYPLLQTTDEETNETILRRVSPERLEQFSPPRMETIQVMESQGIHFRYSAAVVTQLFQTLYQSWNALQSQSEEVQTQVMSVLTDGLVQQIL